MKNTKTMTAIEFLNDLYDVNSTWREWLGDAVVRTVIQGCMDGDEEELLRCLNEDHEEYGRPFVTMDDLWKFSEYAVTELTRRWEEREESGEIDEEEFYWIDRAIEDTDIECYLECLAGRFPRLHAAFTASEWYNVPVV